MRTPAPGHITLLFLAGLLTPPGAVRAESTPASVASSAYLRLQSAHARYAHLAESGGWSRIPDGPTLRPGDRGPRVAALRERLRAEDPALAAFDGPVLDDVFDGGLADALRRFQRRCGLSPDGVAGRRTLAALDVTAAERAAQIALNLERLRDAPPPAGLCVRVNIPAYSLEVVRNDSTVLVLRAIVGRPDRPTPVLDATMTWLECNPAWNVPHKLARDDILPKVREDPTYLAQHNIRVFRSWRDDAPEVMPMAVDWRNLEPRRFAFRFRQDAGPLNPLGRIKFMFPNPHSVDIHDTPGRGAFARSRRALSSGCVRVEDPVALAVRLLEATGGPAAESLTETLASGKRTIVALKRPVPVRLEYRTAWTDRDGVTQFREDLYGLDRERLAAGGVGTEKAESPGADLASVQVHEPGTGVEADSARPLR